MLRPHEEQHIKAGGYILRHECDQMFLIGDKTQFEVLIQARVGSHAYGTNVEGSDEDFKGVFIQPLEHKLLYGEIKQIELSADETYYELNRFLELLQVNNPTITELCFMPEDSITYITDEFRSTFYDDEIRKQFITAHARNSFCGYAYQQIKKAGGLNKKMNFEKDGHFSVEKDPLDFCYVTNHLDGSIIPVKEYLSKMSDLAGMNKQFQYTLTKMNHVPNGYFAYYINPLRSDVRPAGMINDVETGKNMSNELKTGHVPKGDFPDFSMHFNHGAYKEHAKKHKEYKTWIKNRNEQRYVDSQKHGQKIDGKNLLHCVRLLDMGEELVDQRWLNVRRPNAEYLKSIRFGEVILEDLLKDCEVRLREIEDKFRASDLRKNIPPSLIRDIKKKFHNL